MIFENKDFYVDLLEKEDLKDIVEIYNSNIDFLKNHLNTGTVTYEWMDNELETMKKANFYSCKIIKKNTNEIIGLIDFKIGKETYLSLLMVHKKYKNKGVGKSIYQSLEKYVKLFKSNCIRIDVVTNYDKNVIDFWSRNGFKNIKEIQLNWGDKILPAIIMKKKIAKIQMTNIAEEKVQ
ncbi:GNAT family N-acetyltransferase [Senegalia massiliensis]|uniref:GNAT family N-acetyltransferase n=1 Tax=Senegalia massiliensis TaxID=1720316 RepID=A0A845QWQ4_9CLOT|nr:GNAT family N-acetyltransferase [Senegalia massiliensis]NBI05582.1 GNAT family N-acetyltransferase [Senegalia massiliensis]